MLKRLLTLIRDSLIYGASGLLGQVVGFLLLPLYTEHIPPAGYGVLAMVTIIPMVFPVLAAAGMKSAVFQQYHRTEEESRRRAVLTTGMLSVFLSSLGLLVVGVLFAGPLANLLIGQPEIQLVRLSFLSAAVATLGEIPIAILQSQRRIKTVAVLNIAQLVATIAVTIFLVVGLDWGAMGVVVGGLVGQLLDTGILLILVARSFAAKIDWPMWKTMAAYSLPFLPHRLLAIAMVFFSEYMVRYTMGLAEMGVYFVALRFALPIGFVSGALQQAWTPYKFKIFAEDPNPAAFFRSIFTYYVAGIAYLWVGLSLWGPELVTLMTAPKFHAAAALIWAVCLLRVMQAIYPMLATGIELSDNTRAVPLTTTAGLLTVLISAPILISIFGAMGAALATALAWFAVGIAFYFVAQRQIYIRYDLPTVAGLAVLAVVFIVLGHQAHHLDLWARLPILVGLSLLFPPLAFLILMRSETERHRMEIVWNKLSRLRRSRVAPPVADPNEVAVNP